MLDTNTPINRSLTLDPYLRQNFCSNGRVLDGSCSGVCQDDQCTQVVATSALRRVTETTSRINRFSNDFPKTLVCIPLLHSCITHQPQVPVYTHAGVTSIAPMVSTTTPRITPSTPIPRYPCVRWICASKLILFGCLGCLRLSSTREFTLPGTRYEHEITLPRRLNIKIGGRKDRVFMFSSFLEDPLLGGSPQQLLKPLQENYTSFIGFEKLTPQAGRLVFTLKIGTRMVTRAA